MSGPQPRFDPGELRGSSEGEPSTAESADALAAARALETLAASDGIHPTEGFEDRVMAAIATEPVPNVVVRSGKSVRGGRPAAFLLAVRDAWGVATTGGRPFAMRAQAIAFVLLVVLAAGSLATAGAVTVGGLFGQGPRPTPTLPAPTVAPTSTESPEPNETFDVNQTAEPTETAEPGETAEPTETVEPTETAEPTETPRATRTPRPTDTLKPGETPEPTDSPEPSDNHGGGSGGDGSGGNGSGSGDGGSASPTP